MQNDTKSPLILVIDDDPYTRLKLRQMVQQEGYRIEAVNDGEQGLEAYERLQPDLVLVDAMMPVMDGFTFCQQLQTLPGSERTPVLMITGLDDQASVDQAFEVGAVDFVTKPIHWPILRQRMQRVLREAQLSQDLVEANHNLQRANQEFYRLAIVDDLTQVANRRRFNEYLQQEWQRMSREQSPLSLILGDVDSFKAYNDAYGHPAGDRCLQSVAKAFRLSATRPADLVARYGGEEFVVILPNTVAAGAMCVAKQIQDTLSAFKLPHAQSLVSDCVTISLGVASLISATDTTPEALILAADKALYQAKTDGRNRVVIACSGGLCCMNGSSDTGFPHDNTSDRFRRLWS
ncbi:PleD family two-component system response regulator [Nodosilinea sp. LEGE 07298]|uniref:GGDEF domain-containing response regulator n=1 Tax=Nodosilinea sp. LEGE 07298 TaxID=2777970 RepID=UPI00187E154D|nr:PleD family two-component system response regulator [Nodosilinea sp. LEGE 07298]MBE9108170.1 PleD family two-component system response regulator [Nodosilinea sp. LEGE 07298]